MELEKYVHKHGKVQSPSHEKLQFSNSIDVAVIDAFLVWCLRFADVPPEYIEIVLRVAL